MTPKAALGKYIKRRAYFPVILSNGRWIWLESYYEMYHILPVVEHAILRRRISIGEYLLEILRGKVVDGYDIRAKKEAGLLWDI